MTTLRDAADRAAKCDLLVAEADGEVVGAVAYCGPGSSYAELAGPGEAEFRMLAVREKARGRGAGTAMVLECVGRARAAGLATLRLSTQANMTDAHRLYERLGFVRTPERDWSARPRAEADDLRAGAPAPQRPGVRSPCAEQRAVQPIGVTCTTRRRRQRGQ